MGKNLTIKPADGSDPVTVPKEWTGIGEFSLAGHPLKRGTEDLLGVRHDILEAPDRTFPLFAYRKQDGYTVVIPDKYLDKIKVEYNKEERELSVYSSVDNQFSFSVKPVLKLQGTTEEKIAVMRGLMEGKSASGIVSEEGLKGLDELTELFGFIANAGVSQEVEMDLSLARGLNYYTGAIFEVKALDFAIGSICGGGRYDNLTGIFGLPGMSGVGISFGADRIYDVLKGLDKFPKGLAGSASLLFANMDAAVIPYLVPVVKTLREAGVACEIYPDQSKLKKQFDYADKKGIPFVSINGGDEAAAGQVNVKNLSTGEQKSFSKDDIEGLISFLQK